MRCARRIDQRGIAGRIGVRMQRLQRIDQHAGNVAACSQDVQRLLRHLGERIGLVRGNRIADARLHVPPPAVIGPGKANEVRPLGVVARKPHRLHHGLGAGHMERNFVLAGNFADALYVLGDDGMIEAEHRPEVPGALLGRSDALLVEVVAEDVHAVGAGEVVEHVAVDIGHGDAGGRFHEGGRAEVFLHQARELERHAIGAGELQVGDLRDGLRRQLPPLGVAIGVELCERKERVPAFGRDFRRRAVGVEVPLVGKLVKRQQARHTPRHLRMSGQRAVLGPRQIKARLDLGEGDGGAGHRSGGQ